MEQRIKRTEISEKTSAGSEVLGMYLARARQHRILSRCEEAALAARIREETPRWESLVRASGAQLD